MICMYESLAYHMYHVDELYVTNITDMAHENKKKLAPKRKVIDIE